MAHTTPAITSRSSTLILLLLGLMGLVSFSQGHMGITAYEYHRKFHRTLTLRECPFRQEQEKLMNGTMEVHDVKCNIRKQGVQRRLLRPLSKTRNELITSTDGVVRNLGLCGARAAAYLGILYEGDCLAIDIASRLTFSEKTVVRVFIGYYRTALDILDTTDQDITDGREIYVKNKYYVKNLSYGTLDVIIVQFRFTNRTQAAMAHNYTQTDPKMSAYMKGIKERVGEPKSVKIIGVSTMTYDEFSVDSRKKWSRAMRAVEILEMKIKSRHEIIEATEVSHQPHLKYDLFPFVDGEDKEVSGRLPDPQEWERTSLLEVNLRHTMTLAKKMNKKCKKASRKSEVCPRVRAFRRKLWAEQKKVHKVRSAWTTLTPEEKKRFIKRNQSEVERCSRMAKTLYKEVKKMIRRQKLNYLAKKRNKSTSLNEIPPGVSTRGHRIRHARNKLNRGGWGKAARRAQEPNYRNLGWP